jgi:cystathionine beta-lyase/cystathionine gamma-synthase
MRLETAIIHAGEAEPRISGAVAMPIFQSSTFEHTGASGDYHQVRYIRLNNTPNHQVRHAKLQALEGTEAALVTGSGMAAISSALLGVLSAGDHLIAHNCLYGGTYDLLTKDLPRLGIRSSFVDGDDPRAWQRALQPETRAIYVEAISNPLFEVVDLVGAAEFARAHGLVSFIDSTLVSPINLRPAELGFDLVLHSATKYLNGHSDIVAGAVCGRRELVARAKRTLDHLGGTLDPHACFLLHRGLKTLALRVRHQNASALSLAERLAAHPAVGRVNHPGLPSHRQHERARRLLRGTGGTFSFELVDGVAAAERLLSRLRIPIQAPSLGGPETLITRPATTSHAGLTPEERRQHGISDALVRVSVGLESTEDLIDDFVQALG